MIPVLQSAAYGRCIRPFQSVLGNHLRLAGASRIAPASDPRSRLRTPDPGPGRRPADLPRGTGRRRQAQTGSGKTAAYLLTIFHRLLTVERTSGRDTPRALIVAPTGSWRFRSRSDAEKLAVHTDLVTHVVFGGLDYAKQRSELRQGVDLLIGTPADSLTTTSRGSTPCARPRWWSWTNAIACSTWVSPTTCVGSCAACRRPSIASP
jgi:hypothetical protein